MSPTTTRSGASPSTTSRRCSRSSCSTALRPGWPGSRSCASGRGTAPPSTGSTPNGSRRTATSTSPASSPMPASSATAPRSLPSWATPEPCSTCTRRVRRCTTSCGPTRRSATAGHGRPRTSRSPRPRPRRCPRSSSVAGSGSSARRSSTPSCRPSASSTITWRRASEPRKRHGNGTNPPRNSRAAAVSSRYTTLVERQTASPVIVVAATMSVVPRKFGPPESP